MTSPDQAAVLAAIDAAQAALTAAKHAIQAAAEVPQTNNLIALKDGWGPITGSTLIAWARRGQLKAQRGARGKWLADETAIREAVAANPPPPRFDGGGGPEAQLAQMKAAGYVR